jgi:hypothetical protein
VARVPLHDAHAHAPAESIAHRAEIVGVEALLARSNAQNAVCLSPPRDQLADRIRVVAEDIQGAIVRPGDAARIAAALVARDRDP